MEKSFPELAPLELYGLWRLRQRVFVLEQRCFYEDIDAKDLQSRHLWLASPEANLEPAAYLRILPPGLSYPEPSLGRIVIAPERRGQRLGRELIREGLARLWARYGLGCVRLSAQAHLETFYGALGFRRASEDYVEDGIPHLEMVLEPLTT